MRATQAVVSAIWNDGWLLAGWVGSLPRSVFLIMGAFLLAMVGICGFVAWRSWRVGRWLRRAAPGTAAGSETGLIHLEGRAEASPRGPIKAHVSGVPCCWCRWTVEECVQSAGGGGSGGSRWQWRTVTSGQSDRPIVLVDATGRCAVSPSGADVFPTDRTVWFGSDRRPLVPPPSRGSPGDRSMASGTVVVMGTPAHRYRYTEECLYPGDPLFVVGWRGDHEDPADEDSPDEDDGHEDEDDEGAEDTGNPAQRESPRPDKSGESHPRVGRPPTGHGILFLSALSREKTMAVHRHGVIGAGMIALLLMATFLCFLWSRF